MHRRDLEAAVVMGGISLAVYVVAGLAVARACGAAWGWSWAVGLMVAGGWLAVLGGVELISPMSKRSSGGWIRLNLKWTHLWLAPGFVLGRSLIRRM